jgi:uncharacterized membrane protein
VDAVPTEDDLAPAEPPTDARVRPAEAPPRRIRLQGLPRRAAASVAEHPAAVVLAAVMATWIVTFGRLVVQRHDRFGSFGFDMGIYDQGIWLVAHGHHFVTVRGLDLFGHHVNVPLLLLAPFSWLGLVSPNVLNVAQVVMLALGAVPVWLLARWRFGGDARAEWTALVPAIALLAHPSMQFVAWELFHPDVWAIAPMLGAWYAARTRHWGWYWGCVGWAMAWKEDVGLAVAVMGVLLAFVVDRRVGIWSAVVGITWFLIATRVIIPSFTEGGAFYDEFYGDLGTSSTEVAWNSVRHPDIALDHLDHTDGIGYARDLAAPYGFTSYASPAALIGAPQAAANLLSVQTFTADTKFHYVSMPLVGLTIGMVEGIAAVSRARWWRRHERAVRAVLLATVALGAWHTTTQWGPSPIGEEYDLGYWWPRESPHQDDLRGALAVVPDDAAVSATYNLVPHLTHRVTIFEWPNPWIVGNWGTSESPLPEADAADWIVIDTTLLGGDAQAALWRRLVGAEGEGGEFAIRYDVGGVVVAERVAPAAEQAVKPGG